jgi:hypothetical protein
MISSSAIAGFLVLGKNIIRRYDQRPLVQPCTFPHAERKITTSEQSGSGLGYAERRTCAASSRRDRHQGHTGHAILILDQAGWHGAKELRIPANISLLPLPPRAPELNSQREYLAVHAPELALQSDLQIV